MKYTLEEEYEYDFRLIGISCHEKDYRICWGLNNRLHLSLAKEEVEIEVMVKKTNEFIEKATWTLAISIMVLSVGSRFVYTPDLEKRNAFLDRVEESTPAAPAPGPGARDHPRTAATGGGSRQGRRIRS